MEQAVHLLIYPNRDSLEGTSEMNTAINDFGDAVMASLSGALALIFTAVPKLLAFLVIVIVGWLIATLIARAIAAMLRSVSFNSLAQSSGFSAFVHDMGITTDASGLIANVAKWFIRLIALVVGFDALGLPAVSQVLQELLLWLPNLVVALVVLVVGGLLADALSKLVRGSTSRANFSNPDIIAAVARVSVWAFAIIVAVNQLGIATTLVNTLFMAAVGAIALAGGLAFGLGGRETAEALLTKWSSEVNKNKAKLIVAADAAVDANRNVPDDAG